MVSTFKSLSKGTKRLIIVGGIIFPLVVGPITAPSHVDDFDIILFSYFFFFPLYSILLAMGLWVYSGYVRDDDERMGEVEELANAVGESIDMYKDAISKYKNKSKMDLMNDYSDMKEGSKENMERLALEDELVRRDMLDESPMRKKAQNIKDKMFDGSQ